MANSNKSNDFIEIDSNIAEGMELFLIERVRQHPIIYSKDDKYRSHILYNQKLAEAWNEISDDLNVEVESCKALWVCIKQKFIKHRKKKEHGQAITKDWPAYQGLLEWLDEHVKKRRTRNEIIKRIEPTRGGKAKEQSGRVTPIVTFEDEDTETGDTTEWKFCTLLNGNDNEEHTSSLKKRPISTTLTYLGKRRKTTSNSQKQQFQLIPKKPLLKREEYDDLNSIEFEHNQHETEYDDGDAEILTELEFADAADTSIEIIDANNKAEKTVEILDSEKVNNDENIEGNTSGAQIVSNDKSAACRDVVLEANFDKLEQVIGKCVALAEQCISSCANQDSNEVFGKFVASMVKELPLEKRMKARFDIIQFTGDLIAKAMKK